MVGASEAPAQPVRRWRDAAPLAVVVGIGLAALVAWRVGPREGALVLAGVLALAAVARSLLPPGAAGALAVRSRLVDVLLLSGLAVGVAVLARVVPVDGLGI